MKKAKKIGCNLTTSIKSRKPAPSFRSTSDEAVIFLKKQTVDRGAEFESGSFGCIQWEIIIGNSIHIEIIDCDDELGLYSRLGGDGINLLDWLAERGTFYPLSLHTVNPFGYRNMRKKIERYWK